MTTTLDEVLQEIERTDLLTLITAMQLNQTLDQLLGRLSSLAPVQQHVLLCVALGMVFASIEGHPSPIEQERGVLISLDDRLAMTEVIIRKAYAFTLATILQSERPN